MRYSLLFLDEALFLDVSILFLLGKNRHGIGEKKVATFDWEWGRNWAPREGQKIPVINVAVQAIFVLFL